MRYFVGLILVLTLGVAGCSETTGSGGSGGDGGTGGGGAGGTETARATALASYCAATLECFGPEDEAFQNCEREGGSAWDAIEQAPDADRVACESAKSAFFACWVSSDCWTLRRLESTTETHYCIEEWTRAECACGLAQDSCTLAAQFCEQGDIGNVYECIDEPLCTPVYGPLPGWRRWGYVFCSNASQEECLDSIEWPVDDGPGFCKQVIDENRETQYFVWELVTFCEEDSDCGDGYTCDKLEEYGMLKGECTEGCIYECGFGTCPEGQSCVCVVYCGGCSPVVDACWDGMSCFCL